MSFVKKKPCRACACLSVPCAATPAGMPSPRDLRELPSSVQTALRGARGVSAESGEPGGVAQSPEKTSGS